VTLVLLLSGLPFSTRLSSSLSLFFILYFPFCASIEVSELHPSVGVDVPPLSQSSVAPVLVTDPSLPPQRGVTNKPWSIVMSGEQFRDLLPELLTHLR
jgi:hypothetical protein